MSTEKNPSRAIIKGARAMMTMSEPVAPPEEEVELDVPPLEDDEEEVELEVDVELELEVDVEPLDEVDVEVEVEDDEVLVAEFPPDPAADPTIEASQQVV
jgi:hypothetical protein